MTTRVHQKRATWATPPKRRRTLPGWRSPGLWAFVALVGIVVLVLALSAREEPKDEGIAGSVAPAFVLPSTDGDRVDLADYRGEDVLLYFSEGVGCDPCFTQMADIEQNASRMLGADLTVVPIVVNDADDVRREIARFGLETPFLIDADKRVSEMYGVLGTGHHADLPGHGFALVDGGGRLVWQKNYPVMFVKTEELLADMGRAG